MTRLVLVCSVALIAISPALAWAQNAAPPAGPSRYAPAAAPRVATQQPPAGQAPQGAAQFPVRPANAQQPAGAIPAAGPAIAPPNQPIMPTPPAWAAQMGPAEQKWVDDVLRFWETRSEKTKLFECKFQRWDYDPVFGPRGKAKTIAEGVIKYAQPEKGLYRVEKLWSYVAPAKPGDKEYFDQDATFGEHWVCDGQRVFEFDARNKRLVERALPPEMRGRAIADGPLPFMFGARAETIKARYWIHGLPESGNGKYWLEAVPRSLQDAQNFSRVRIVLDEKDFLPESLQVFAPNFDEQTNPSKQTYAFSNRKTTDKENFLKDIAKGLDPLHVFFKADDFNPKLPAGWQKVVENDLAAASGPAPKANPAGIPQRQIPPLPR